MPAMETQIHGKESEIACYISKAEAVVEFDTVQNLDSRRKKVDLFQPKVAMAVPNPALANAPSEGLRMPIEEAKLTRLEILGTRFSKVR
jgi:hypothetical protein